MTLVREEVEFVTLSEIAKENSWVPMVTLLKT
jgi:hypothetical protein